MGMAMVFPGQGSQAPGMGAPWQQHPAWSVVLRAEEALGEALSHLLVEADARTLSRTREAQLAMFLHGLVVWGALEPQLPEPVSAFAGHSLGQVTALTAAGVLEMEDAVRFVAVRAEATQAAADRTPGAMAALLGAGEQEAAAACAAAPGACWLANDNAPGQVVVAGTPEGVKAAGEEARSHGVRRVLPLDVGGAFHTPLMDPARPALVAAVAAFEPSSPSAPVASNDDGRLHTDTTAWRERLVEHPLRPVRWRACTEALAAAGVTLFVEAGARTLSGLVRRTVPEAEVHPVVEPADLRLPAVAT